MLLNMKYKRWFVFYVGGYFTNIHGKGGRPANFTLPELPEPARLLSFYYKFIPTSYDTQQVFRVTVCGNVIFNASRRGATNWTWTGNIQFSCSATNPEVCWPERIA